MTAYVIITPAHNEQDFIERTLESMVVQTMPPLKWVVVDDGSTDGTAEVVARYAARFPFIELVRKPRDADRNFARKVAAFNHGLASLEGLPYDYIGNIDADMSFGPDYFERIIAKFEADPRLGISGGIVHTRFVHEFRTHDTTLDSVGGKVQLFRRRCFEDIEGYRALKFGGIDATAEIMARMKDWKVEKSLSTPAWEHRPTGFAYGNALNIKICEGRRFYSLGYDPTFFLLRCVYRIREHPFLLGSVAAWARYTWGRLRREAIALPSDVVAYLRNEQRAKIRRQFQRRSN